MGHASAVQLAHYTGFVAVASAALGGGSESKPAPVEDLTGLDTDDFLRRVNQIGTV